MSRSVYGNLQEVSNNAVFGHFSLRNKRIKFFVRQLQEISNNITFWMRQFIRNATQMGQFRAQFMCLHSSPVMIYCIRPCWLYLSLHTHLATTRTVCSVATTPGVSMTTTITSPRFQDNATNQTTSAKCRLDRRRLTVAYVSPIIGNVKLRRA